VVHFGVEPAMAVRSLRSDGGEEDSESEKEELVVKRKRGRKSHQLKLPFF
jgi:hypothetical protein